MVRSIKSVAERSVGVHKYSCQWAGGEQGVVVISYHVSPYYQGAVKGEKQLAPERYYSPVLKEQPRVNRTQDPVEDQKSQLLGFSEILLECCSILVKVYKNVHFTEFHSIL